MPKSLNNNDIDEKLKSHPYKITRYEDYKGTSARNSEIKFICENGHIFNANVDRVINRHVKCPICNKFNHWNNEFVDTEIYENKLDVKRIGEVTGANHYTKWQCLTNPDHTWSNIPIEVIKGKCKGKCPICAKRHKQTEEELKIRIEKENKTIKLIKYEKNNHLLECNICKHQWKLRGLGDIYTGTSKCPKCAKVAKLTNEEIDRRLLEIKSMSIRHGDYINSITKIAWKCKKCSNIWNEKPHNILYSQQNCLVCFPIGLHKTETYIFEFLKTKFNNVSRNFYIKNCNIKNDKDIVVQKTVIVDFKLIHNNKIYLIEYNGPHHYHPVCYKAYSLEKAERDFIKQKYRDNWLRNYCKNNNIVLIEIDGPSMSEYSQLVNYLNNTFK